MRISSTGEGYKIEEVACLAHYAQTLDQENRHDLRVLVDKAWTSASAANCP